MNIIIWRNLKQDFMKFGKNPVYSFSEKFTDSHTDKWIDRRTTDTTPWQQLDGLRPVELKRTKYSQRAISPFPTVLSTLLENFLPFSSNLKLWSANSFSSEESKICHLGQGWERQLNLWWGNFSVWKFQGKIYHWRTGLSIKEAKSLTRMFISGCLVFQKILL